MKIQARSQVSIFGGAQCIFEEARFLVLLYVWNKFLWAQQILGGTKEIWGALPPNAPRDYGPVKVYYAISFFCSSSNVKRQTVWRNATEANLFVMCYTKQGQSRNILTVGGFVMNLQRYFTKYFQKLFHNIFCWGLQWWATNSFGGLLENFVWKMILLFLIMHYYTRTHLHTLVMHTTQKILRIIKNLHICQARWKTAFAVINYIRELIAQKLDDTGIHSIYGFYWNKSWWCLLRRRNPYSVLKSDSLLGKDFFSIDNGTHLYARKFCKRPTSEVSASEQSRCSPSVERAVLVYIRSVYAV